MQHKYEVIDYKVHYEIRTLTPRQRGLRSTKMNKIAVREKEDDDAQIFETPGPQIVAQSSRTSSATFSGVTREPYTYNIQAKIVFKCKYWCAVFECHRCNKKKKSR